ncbi:recombinase family protein [uncultured Desulfosarcina sp.]|uniref:recombinase family protein n=1 Tax=uncultured Desulfosarcina sp. TaxID=218289 RepID=UPI0029C72244|nr:recombinase family protein [uncultured Desulfosarcina sp.]
MQNSHQNHNTKPKAYSYLRFSTPEQMKGDSFRRQSEAAVHFADNHRLELDESITYQDLGVSAFHGKNVHEGAFVSGGLKMFYFWRFQIA